MKQLRKRWCRRCENSFISLGNNTKVCKSCDRRGKHNNYNGGRKSILERIC